MKQSSILQLFEKVMNNFSYGEIYHCILLLQKQKPHLIIDSVLFTQNYQNLQNEDNFFERQQQKQKILCLKVYDEHEKQYKYLKIYFLERFEHSLNVNQLQHLCLASKIFQRSDLILQIFDSYALVEEDNIKLYFVIEQEAIYSELKHFVKKMNINNGIKRIIEEIVNAAVNYCLNSLLISCKKDVEIQHMQFYIAQQENQINIKLNLVNPEVFQCFQQDDNQLSDLQINQVLGDAQQVFEDDQELFQNLLEFLAFQISNIKDKQSLKPASLVMTISEIIPNLITHHGIQILNIISQEESYQFFQLGQYDKNYFTLKILKNQQTFILKAERFNELYQKEKIFDLYESLSQFTFFVKKEYKKIFKFENFYYLVILEQEIVVRDQFSMLNNSFDELEIAQSNQIFYFGEFSLTFKRELLEY
ncbi:hypothetical protein ABPG72_006641 [Tetrahymena utriculariae]